MLAALARRNETGQGDYIDIGMLDVQVGVPRQPGDELPGFRQGAAAHRQRAIPTSSRRTCSPARDGDMVLVVGNDGQFAKLCEVLGQPEWATRRALRHECRRACATARRSTRCCATILRQRDARRTGSRALDAAGVPCGPINTVPEVFEEPQVQHRGMLRDLPHPPPARVPQVVSPMRFANAPLAFDRAPPLLGEHTDEILRELGLAIVTA